MKKLIILTAIISLSACQPHDHKTRFDHSEFDQTDVFCDNVTNDKWGEKVKHYYDVPDVQTDRLGIYMKLNSGDNIFHPLEANCKINEWTGNTHFTWYE